MSPVAIAVITAIIIIMVITLWRDIRERPVTAEDIERRWPSLIVQTPGKSTAERVPLETQIAALADAGLAMNADVTVDDLLHSFPREEYETGPWRCLLFIDRKSVV